ncbi:MAG TPA: TonB-dependent receptor [Allosphingosinicella sp.]
MASTAGKFFGVDDQASAIARLKSGASLLAVCVFAAASPAYAQTAPASGPGTAGATRSTDNTTAPDPDPTTEDGTVTSADQAADAVGEDEAIVVTGIRQSLANAQTIKRESDTVVDAISAQDIGALPDRSVTEALQRVPGVSINRFAGSNDPDHFSVEGSGVVVRGLNFVRSEFNGRDAFSAGVGGQSLNFADVPSELLGSVEVYKNVTAAMIEGGLAGTVNLNTRKPFDSKGLHIGAGFEMNYGDFRKKYSPTASLLVSNTWDTGAGRFGLLGSVSYSDLRSRSNGIQVTNFQTRDNTQVPYQNGAGVLVCRNPLPSGTDTTTLPAGNAPCGTASTGGPDGFSDFLPLAYAPIGGQFRAQDYDRTRSGIALAGQWESNDRSMLATVQYIRSKSSNNTNERTFETAPDLSEYNTYPAGCVQNNAGPLYNGNGTTRAECPNGALQNYQYDADGLFEQGYITLPGTGWRNASSGSAGTFVPTGGIQQSLGRTQVRDRNLVDDIGVNFQYSPTDRLQIQLDGDYTRSRHDQFSMSVFGSTFADQELDLTGDLPVVIPHKPLTLAAAWAEPNGLQTIGSDDAYFRDQRVQFWRAAMDHAEESTGEEFAFKADIAYDLSEDAFLRKVKFGARYADRDQTIRYSVYNWGALSEVWSGTAPVSIAQAGSERAEFYEFPNFFRGATPGPNGAYYYANDLIQGYDAAADFLKNINRIWHTTNGAGATNDWERLSERSDVIAGTQYRPNEIQRIHQRDKNAYVMVNFDTENVWDGPRITGNAGVRFVQTDLSSFGASRIPNQADLGVTDAFETTNPVTGVVSGRCVAGVPQGAPPGTLPRRPSGVCSLGAAGYAQLQQFAGATSTITPNRVDNDYTYLLPSANLKLEVGNGLQFRLAGSKVLTRPESSYVRSYLDLSVDGNGNLVAAIGNPLLKPATAWQFDATAEWYFSKVGSLTANLFYKDVKNFFYQSTIPVPITNNGITFPAQTRGPANFNGHGKIKGFEVAYQHTFDFLPGLLSGFGTNLNYSYIKSSGLPNTFLNTGTAVTVGSITPGNLPLEGLSKHNANATLFYEKGPISLRAAYNYRSKFLLTAADVIFPYTSIFQAGTGQLDASAFISLTKQIKVGIQGVNLLNTVTKTLQAYKGDPDELAPRSYFVSDRRFSAIIRANF